MKQIYFHIGLSKTGTKFFQNKVFPYLDGVHYIPKRLYHRCFELIEKINVDKILVSQELDQQFFSELQKWAVKYPETKIIMVLRRQDSWFLSQYKRFVKNGFRGFLKDFIDIEQDNGYFKIDDGKYCKKVEFILKHFQSKPLILNYDDFSENPKVFVDKILGFLNAKLKKQINFNKVHQSYNEKQLKVMFKYGEKFGVRLRPYDDSRRFKRFFQRLGQMIPRYFVLYILSNFISEDAVADLKLIDRDYLAKIKDFYSDDWKGCFKFFL